MGNFFIHSTSIYRIPIICLAHFQVGSEYITVTKTDKKKKMADLMEPAFSRLKINMKNK